MLKIVYPHYGNMTALKCGFYVCFGNINSLLFVKAPRRK